MGLFVFLKDIFIISDETHLSLNKDFLSSVRFTGAVMLHLRGCENTFEKESDESTSMPLMHVH